MLKKYLRSLEFFMGASMSWLYGITPSPMVTPTIEEKDPIKSIGYSALMLIIWATLLIGGFVIQKSLIANVPLLDAAVIIIWGFLIAPVVAAVLMRLLFPDMSKRIRVQIDKDRELNRQRIAKMKKK